MTGARLTKLTPWFLFSSVLLLILLIVGYNTEVLTGIGQGTAGGRILWVFCAIAAVGALVTGALTWFRYHLRSVVSVAATVYGIAATLLMIMGSLPQD